MLSKLLFTTIPTFITQLLFCQILPENFKEVNQTQIMFEINEIAKANQYEINLFENEMLVKTIKTGSLAALLSKGIQFNKNYKWNYKAFADNKKIFTSQNFFFKTKLDEAFSNKFLKIEIPVTNKKAGTEAIFMDGIGAAINYGGEIIWKLKNDTFFESNTKKQFRNIEIDKQGNITLLLQDKFYELNLDSKILWKTNKISYFSNDTVEYYHHDAKRLRNGDYLLCSYRFEKENCFRSPLKKCIVKYGSLIQLDANHNLVWSWSEKGNVTNEVTYRNIDTNNLKIVGNHLNGFDVNEKEKLILQSYRDNNRVILVDKNTGKVLLELKPGKQKELNFYGQHSPLFVNDSTFIFYNNNLQVSTSKDSVFNASIIKIQFDKKFNYKKLWEYEYKNKSFLQGTTGKEGYVQSLPNKNYLMGLGGHNNLIEVTEDKKIIWEANIIRRTKKDTTWEEISSYRNHYYTSLYPRYFTIQTALYENQIKINNDGTDDDEYELILKGTKNNLLKSFKIKAGASTRIPLPITAKKKAYIIKPKGIEAANKEIVF